MPKLSTSANFKNKPATVPPVAGQNVRLPKPAREGQRDE